MASSGGTWRMTWRGDDVAGDVHAAAASAIDETMVDAVNHAKGNHAGWRNRTGMAEGSMQVIRGAQRVGARTVGLWGSRGVAYMRPLEFLHGAALRTAGDAVYPRLASRIRERL